MRQVHELVRHRDPLILSPGTSVQHACEAMRNRKVGAALVGEVDDLIGIFTGRDAVCRVLATGCVPAETKLEEVMTRNPDTLPAGRPAIDALRLMQDGGYRHVPVIADGRIVGMVSKGDFNGPEKDRLEEETILWERVC